MELPDLRFNGFELVPFITALVMLAQHFGLADYWADWLRSGLYGLATALVVNHIGLYPPVDFTHVLSQIILIGSVVLLSRGIWPEGRLLLQNAQGRNRGEA